MTKGKTADKEDKAAKPVTTSDGHVIDPADVIEFADGVAHGQPDKVLVKTAGQSYLLSVEDAEQLGYEG